MRLALLPLFVACASEETGERSQPGRGGSPADDAASDDSGATPADDSDTDDALSPAVAILSPADASDGTRAELRAHLDAGRPVVVHAYWTGSGHIAVFVGYTDADWIVNDPAGDWYTCYGCGEADHIAYPIGGEWDAELSVHGDIWWSTGADAPF